MCCCVTGRLAPDVSRQRRSLSYQGKTFMNNSTLDVVTTNLSRNVGHESPSDAPPHPRSTGASNYERLETKHPGKYLCQRRYVKISVINCRPHSCIPFHSQRHYSPGWASASFKSFLHPPRFRATTVQFLRPSFASSSFTPSSQRNLGLPLGRFPPGSLRRTHLDKSSSSWRMTCPAHLNLLNLQNFTMSFSPHN